MTAPSASTLDHSGGRLSRRPNLFVIGAPKAGTTSLYNYLRGHPDIYMSPVKEPFYFSPDVYRTPRFRFQYGRDEEAYLSLFSEAGDEQLVGEASTHYLASPRAPGLIKAFEPSARIVAILRNPVDMVPAWHNERVLKGTEYETDFARLVALEATDPGVYTSIGAYGSQLERWFSAFDPSAIHVIVFDDLVADTPWQFRHLLQFLRIDEDYQPPSFAAHNESSENRRVVSLLRSSPVLGAWRTVKRMVGEDNSRKLGSVRRSRLLRRRRQRPGLAPDTRAALQDRYAAEVARAGELIGRDLTELWTGRNAARGDEVHAASS